MILCMMTKNNTKLVLLFEFSNHYYNIFFLRIFKSTFEELQTAFIKPKTNSVSVSTDLCDINLVCYFIVVSY